LEKLDFIDSKFRLCLLAARRAKQIVSGSRRRFDTGSDNPLTIALEEIYHNRVKYRILELSNDEMDLYTGSHIDTEEPIDYLLDESVDVEEESEPAPEEEEEVE